MSANRGQAGRQAGQSSSHRHDTEHVFPEPGRYIAMSKPMRAEPVAQRERPRRALKTRRSFRLSSRALRSIAALSEAWDCTVTAAVERAVNEMAGGVA